MPTITIVDRLGEARKVEAESGISLMEAIRNEGYEELLAMCGGNCSCATCHVYLEDGPVALIPPAETLELELLSTSAYTEETSRLSCQVDLTPAMNGLRVVIAPED